MPSRKTPELFSVYPELRIAGWLGATMLAAAAALLLKNNLDRIGPLALSIGIGVAAVACYAWTWLRRKTPSVVDDYILLLGALLVSADVAFVESQYHLLGDAWKRHLLILAVVHAAGAYAYNSRILLSLAVSSLAGYLGWDKQDGFEGAALPAFELSALLIAWRAVDRAARAQTTFSRTFEHFAANAALVGGLSLMDDYLHAGTLVTIAVAVAVIAWGFRVRHEPFVLYGFVYGLIAVGWFFLETATLAEVFVILMLMIVGVAGLLFLHRWFKERR